MADAATFPPFDLARAGGGRLSTGDLAGRPWVGYLARHTGCSICQAKLHDLLAREDEIRATGAEIVVFFPTPLSHVEAWRAAHPEMAHLVAVADPDVALYGPLGTKRVSLWHLARRNTRSTLRELRRGNAPKLTRADMLRLGADVVVDANGSISRLHLCDDATDRLSPSLVVDALAATPAVAATA